MGEWMANVGRDLASEATTEPLKHWPRFDRQTQAPHTWLTICGLGARDGMTTYVQDRENVTCEQCRELLGAGAGELPFTLLTDREHFVVEGLGSLWGDICSIVDDGPSREADLAEMIGHVHALQRYIMGQAAARAFPDRFRLLGSTIGPWQP